MDACLCPSCKTKRTNDYTLTEAHEGELIGAVGLLSLQSDAVVVAEPNPAVVAGLTEPVEPEDSVLKDEACP